MVALQHLMQMQHYRLDDYRLTDPAVKLVRPTEI